VDSGTDICRSMSFRIPMARFKTAGVKSAARISFAIAAIFLSIEASMRASPLVPRLIVRDLNFIRLMSLSSAPIFLNVASTPSMRWVARSSRSSSSSSSSSERLTSSLTIRESRPALSRSFKSSSRTTGLLASAW
jgi:hypothetical protein